MSTYAEIKAQIAELERKAKQARLLEIAAAKARIAEIMNAYGLTLADLGGGTKTKLKRQQVAAKYRNNETGETWTGRGRNPLWCGKEQGRFSD